jgi:hypothetical protein
MKMNRYKIFRDETYVFYVEANCEAQAQEIADDGASASVLMGAELISIHNEVIEKKEND